MKKLLILCILFLLSCDKIQAVNNLNIKENIQYIKYVKDKRTGLCFAGGMGTNLDIFTNVPCTPEVEKLLIK